MKGFVFLIKLMLVILLLVFIWGNSLLPGELSSQESDFVGRLLEPIIEPVQGFLEAHGLAVSQATLVRKTAHFTEYAALGAMMFILFLKPDGHSRYILPAALCLAAAAIDESIQIFVDGRGPSVRDVALDFSGACAGILCVGFVVCLFFCVRRRERT